MKAGALVVITLVLASQGWAGTLAYRPGFYRLATKASFVGRIHLDASRANPSEDGNACGTVHEATVVDALVGAEAGARIQFVAQVEPGAWPVREDHFAVLFAHALEAGDEHTRACWLSAAPLFAAASPASVVVVDRDAGRSLGGEFLRVSPDNVLAGLHFAAIELWADGDASFFASWELVRAYARQAPAVMRALPTLPDLPDPTATPEPGQ